MAAVVGAACQWTAAQTLNLDAPAAPPPGTGGASVELVERLDAQIKSLEAQRGTSSADGSLELRLALRVLARNLINAGEQTGEPGSAQVVAGSTLGLRMDAIDLRLRTRQDMLTPEIASGVVQACTLAPEKLPVDAETLWRFLRDALAPMVESAPPMIEPQKAAKGLADQLRQFRELSPPVDDLAAAAASSGQSDQFVSACLRLEQLLDTAAKWPAYARTSAMIRANATEAIWLVAARPGMPFSVEQRRVLADRFIEAVELICAARLAGELPKSGDAADQGATTLRVMAMAARCIDRASRCDPPAPAGPVRDAVAHVVVGWDPKTNRPSDPSKDISAVQRLSRADMLLSLLTPPNGTEFVAADQVLRQLRPAIKTLEESRRQAAGELLEVLVRAVVSPDVLGDPAFLSAMTSYRRRLEDLVIADTITRRVGEQSKKANGGASDWVLASAYEGFGDRLLVLAKGLNSPREHDEAIEEWRQSGRMVVLLGGMDGESDARRGVADQTDRLAEHLRVVSGGRAADVLGRLDEARTEWLEEAKKARKIKSEALQAASKRLVTASVGVSMMLEMAELRASLAGALPGTASADAGSVLGAWELSAQAATTLASVDMRAIATALALIADGKFDEFAAAGWESPGTRVRGLVVEVASRARRLGAHALTDVAADAFRQLGTGTADPDREDPLALRNELMVMSRYLEELGWSLSHGEQKQQAELMAFLETREAAVRGRVERWR